jgi:adenosine deaminase CECR1
LGKYVGFFKELLEEILVKCARQKIYIVELRHIVGLLFDDDRKSIGLEEELKIIEGVLEKVRASEGLSAQEFSLRLILSGLKIIGRPHVAKAMAAVTEGRTYSDIIAGFDMVNQENVTPPILSFVPDILDGKRRDAATAGKGGCLPCFFHCGETHDRGNQNIFDAVLLGSKRLGHGFQLFLHPHLQTIVK